MLNGYAGKTKLLKDMAKRLYELTSGEHVNCVYFNAVGDIVGLDNLKLILDDTIIKVDGDMNIPRSAEMMAILDHDGREMLRRSVLKDSFVLAEITAS